MRTFISICSVIFVAGMGYGLVSDNTNGLLYCGFMMLYCCFARINHDMNNNDE